MPNEQEEVKCFWCNQKAWQSQQAEGMFECRNPECVAACVPLTETMLRNAQSIYETATTCECCENDIGGICWECA